MTFSFRSYLNASPVPRRWLLTCISKVAKVDPLALATEQKHTVVSRQVKVHPAPAPLASPEGERGKGDGGRREWKGWRAGGKQWGGELSTAAKCRVNSGVPSFGSLGQLISSTLQWSKQEVFLVRPVKGWRGWGRGGYWKEDRLQMSWIFLRCRYIPDPIVPFQTQYGPFRSHWLHYEVVSTPSTLVRLGDIKRLPWLAAIWSQIR